MTTKVNSSLRLFACLLAIWGALLQMAHGQGATSTVINGFVEDAQGQPIGFATVKAVHVPTNTTFTSISKASGRFSFPAVPVGGPFTISATAEGRTVPAVENVMTTLGEPVDVILKASGGEEVVHLEKFVVESASTDLDASSTGASTVLSAQRLAMQPTSNRSFADIIKTNPFVTVRAYPQVTALGMNNRYNSITLDGARLNDQFGLASSGLLSLRNPFSLDAVEQFSVALTPFDVTESGFAGASINVVSKSGTNQFHGSAYVLYTSDKWQGKDLSGTNVGKRPARFIERTWGMTLGGPIIKNRLFFFAQYEKFTNPTAGPSNAGFLPSSGFLSWLSTQIKALPGSPDMGTFGNVGAVVQEDTKRLLKLDWNINSQHRLTVRYSDTKGANPNFGSFNVGNGFSSTVVPPGTTTTGFTNGITSLSSSYYTLSVKEEVYATQLFSNWTPDFNTQLSFSKNDSTSLRTTPVNFPEIRIFNVPGTSSANGSSISTADAFTFGTELSSSGNGLISHGQNYSGIANYTWRDYTFKAGFDHEETRFENLFRAGSYGVFGYNYSDTLDLANAQPLGFARGVAQQGFPGTDLSEFQQTGYFGQVKWQPNPRFSATLGLRYDVFGSPIAPPYNGTFSAAFNSLYPGIRNNGTIDGASRLAPRLSFNYAVDQERLTQVRGGIGVFTGRNPWVWLSNSYGNAGYGRYNVTTTSANSPTLAQYLNGTFSNTDPAYRFNPNSPMGTTSLSPTTSSSVTINMIDPNLELPTNWRGSLAIDRRIPFLDAVVTVEYIHNEVMKAMFYDNLNLKVLNGDAQNKPTASSYGADGRLRFSGSASSAPLVSGYGNVLRLRNVDVGSSDYVAIMLDRPMKNNWAYNLSYTHGRAREAQPAGSSTASSNWSFNIVFNQGAVEVQRADYEITDRVQFTLSRQFHYFKRLATTVSAYYEGRTGQPFSYVYSGDLNRDGSSANDVVAVPTGLNDQRFDFSQMNDAQKAAYLKAFQDNGLMKYAGGYAPRNAFTTPWQNRLDLYFSQEVKVYRGSSLEVFANFINFGSWLSKGLFNYVEEINTSTSNSNQLRALGNASYGSDGRIVPTFTADANGNLTFPSTSTIVPNNADSRWRIQAGIRLKF